MNSVFEKPYIKTPIATLKRFLKSLKWAWQRATKGYCEKDVWNIDSWFLSIIPCMLEELKNNHMGFLGILKYGESGKTYEEYSKLVTEEEKEVLFEEGNKSWEEILSLMIFLFKESFESTCTKTNPYKKEHDATYEEFEDKYGMFGEKLLTDAEQTEAKRTGMTRLYIPDELTEYKEICSLYYNEMIRIDEYRAECEKKAFELFVKWFHYLWD